MDQAKRIDQFGKNVPFIVNTGLKALRLSPEGIEVCMPFQPNKNHIGIMYSGALFTLAECTGAAVFTVYFKREDNFVLIKGMNIKFKRPAKENITCTCRMDPDATKPIFEELEKNGKADYSVQLEIKDSGGDVVAVAEGFYQVRKGSTL